MTTTFFYDWPLWCACSFSGQWACRHGTLLCEFSIPRCGGVSGGNDQNRAEKQNVVAHLVPTSDLVVRSSWSPISCSQQAGDRGRRGGLVEGIAALLRSENGSRYRGVSQLHTNRATVCNMGFMNRFAGKM